MLMTVRAIRDALEMMDVSKLSDGDPTKIGAKLAYRMGRNIARMAPIAKQFHETRLNLNRKYGEEQERDGQRLMMVKPEHMDRFMAEIRVLLDEKEDIEIKMVPASMVLALTPLQQAALGFMTEDQQEE